MSNPKQDAGASEGARRATEDAPASLATAGGGRWSSKRKVSVIVELLRGADLESTSPGDVGNLADAFRPRPLSP